MYAWSYRGNKHVWLFNLSDSELQKGAWAYSRGSEQFGTKIKTQLWSAFLPDPINIPSPGRMFLTRFKNSLERGERISYGLERNAGEPF